MSISVKAKATPERSITWFEEDVEGQAGLPLLDTDDTALAHADRSGELGLGHVPLQSEAGDGCAETHAPSLLDRLLSFCEVRCRLGHGDHCASWVPVSLR